jgi:AmpE protein
MSQTLLAILLAVAAAHALPDLARWRDFSWLQVWLARWSREGTGARPAAILLPLLLVVLCGLIWLALQHVLFGLPAFAFAVIVLYYCWGPRDLDADVDAVLKAPDSERRHAAAQALRPDPALAPLPFESAPLVEATFASALSRWFGLLFWFVLLGPAGALGYRAVQLIARHPAFTAEVAAEQRSRLERIALVLDWAPSHLVALTLALVSDFDAVIKTWRDYHAAHGQGYFTLDLGFLGALARAGIDADVVAGDGYAADVDDPLVELADARTVLRRILVVWLVLVALVALAGVGG